jgi:hypothetical protein
VTKTAPPVGEHPTNAASLPQTTNPPSIHFGTGGQGQWSIQTSSKDHQYAGQDQSRATGEWGQAFINSRGVVSYQQDSSAIGSHTPGPGDTVSYSTTTFTSSPAGSGGAVVNPGGHVMNNNGAVHGNAWWKHAVPGTSQIVTEQIESRSHNEFYDVFKDGQYVGTYQVSANAVHEQIDEYQLWRMVRPAHGNHPATYTSSGLSPKLDRWSMTDVLVQPLPPEPADPPGDTASQNDDPNSPDGEESDLYVQLDSDEQDLQQSDLKEVNLQKHPLDLVSADLQSPQEPLADIKAIAEALKSVSSPDSPSDQVTDLSAVNPSTAATEQQAELPTPEKISDSLAALTHSDAGERVLGSQPAPTQQDLLPAQTSDSVATAPSTEEVAQATEQVIASAPPPGQSASPIDHAAKPEDQDPFRDAPPEPTSPDDETAPSEEMLAEEPPPAIDQQHDDDLPPLG